MVKTDSLDSRLKTIGKIYPKISNPKFVASQVSHMY